MPEAVLVVMWFIEKHRMQVVKALTNIGIWYYQTYCYYVHIRKHKSMIDLCILVWKFHLFIPYFPSTRPITKTHI